MQGFILYGFLQMFFLTSVFASPPPKHLRDVHATRPIGEVFGKLKNTAIQKSPDLAQAQATLSQKKAQVYTSLTRWFPHLDFELSRTKSKDYSLSTSGALGTQAARFTPEEVNRSRFSFDLTMPVYKRSVQLGLEKSYAEKELAELDFQIKFQEFNWKLHSLFGNYLLQLYKLAIIKKSIEIANTNQKEAKLRFDLGQRTKIDVLKADTNVLSLESKKLQYEQDYALAQSQLLEDTGLTSLEFSELDIQKLYVTEEDYVHILNEFTVFESHLENLKEFLGSNGEAILTEKQKTLIEQHIAQTSAIYKNHLSNQDLSDVLAKEKMSQEWPELLVQGSVYKQGPDWEDIKKSQDRSYSIALVLRIPLFSGGSLISSYLEQSYSFVANEVKTQKNILQLKNEVENDLFQIHTSRKLLESQAINLNQNEELVRLSQKSYQLGKATFLELLTNQNDLMEAKLGLAQTKVNLSVLLRKFTWKLGIPFYE